MQKSENTYKNMQECEKTPKPLALEAQWHSVHAVETHRIVYVPHMNDMLFRSSNTNFDLTEQLPVEVHLQFSLPGIWEFPSPQDGGLRRSFHKNLRYRKHFQSFPTFVFSLQATTHFNTRQGNQSQQSKRKRGRVLESKSTPQPHFTFVSKSTCRLWTIRIYMLDVMTRSIKL